MIDDLVADVRDYWGFTGIQPDAVTAVSPFGHAIVRDVKGALWYLDPELRSLERIAHDDEGLFVYMNNADVREVWFAEALVAKAHALLGPPPAGRCYALKPLAMLAGDYASNDFWHAPIGEIIRFSGSVAQQTAGFPDGQVYEIKVVD